jgi:hypothetical protein
VRRCPTRGSSVGRRVGLGRRAAHCPGACAELVAAVVCDALKLCARVCIHGRRLLLRASLRCPRGRAGEHVLLRAPAIKPHPTSATRSACDATTVLLEADRRGALCGGGGSFLRAGGVLDSGRVAHARRRQGRQAQAHGGQAPQHGRSSQLATRCAARLQQPPRGAPSCLRRAASRPPPPITHIPLPTCPETSPCASCIEHSRAAPSACSRRAGCRSVSGARLCWHGRRARARPHTPRSVCAVHCRHCGDGGLRCGRRSALAWQLLATPSGGALDLPASRTSACAAAASGPLAGCACRANGHHRPCRIADLALLSAATGTPTSRRPRRRTRR